MTVTTHPSFCRVCQASCGVLVDVERGRITNVRGDPENPLTRGFICSKGRESPAIHHGPSRLRTSQKRRDDGSFEAIESSQAIDEIAARLAAIAEVDGPDSIALFMGTYGLFGTLISPFARGWLQALGSRSLYTTGTIDQSAKWIVPLRMGYWEGGWQSFDESDVWLLAGTNPLVSMEGGNLTGFPAYDPVRRLREAKKRGLTLIVIDPRRTETARYADIYLQPHPGQDAPLFASLLHVVLEEKLFDVTFCSRYVADLEQLRSEVAEFAPSKVDQRTGVAAAEIVRAARAFATARRGMAHAGTGSNMAPHSNLTEHLITALNVVCGRYARGGEQVSNPGVLRQKRERRESVVAPSRDWEKTPCTRVGGYGQLWGEYPTNALCDQILEAGPGRIRALIVEGGNPAAAWPDQEKSLRALKQLDLLVVVDPRMSETARLADYVIAPTLPFERPDNTLWYELFFPVPFAQHTPALIDAPPGTIDDWRFFFELARRMDLSIPFGARSMGPSVNLGETLDMSEKVEAETLLRLASSSGEVPYDDVLSAPHGRIFDVKQSVSGPPKETGQYQLLPDDVLDELRAVVSEARDHDGYPFRLICRRVRHVMNSFDPTWRSVQGQLGKPTGWMNPEDLTALGIPAGTLVEIESPHGSISAALLGDRNLRRGVVSMPHCWEGASTARLVDSGQRESINAMPRMSAIPVRVRSIEGEIGTASRTAEHSEHSSSDTEMETS